MKFILLIVILLPIQVHASPRLDLLLDVICYWETRNLDEPDEYVGIAAEVGRCAVRIGTARMVGFKGTGLDLMDRDTNRMVAQDVLLHCLRRKNDTAYALAQCYNFGPYSRIKRSEYARQIASDYAELYKRKFGPGIRLARI